MLLLSCFLDESFGLIECLCFVTQDIHCKVDQISLLLGQMIAVTNPQINSPVQSTAPSRLQPLQVAGSLLSVKRAKSRKRQAVQSAKLSASSADDIQLNPEALVSNVLEPTTKNVEKGFSQKTLTVTVSEILFKAHCYLT